MRELDCSPSFPSPDASIQCDDPALTALGASVESSALHEAAKALGQGFLVAFPTETVYGLGADGLNPNAVLRIFEAKGRPKGHPLILHAADLATALKVSPQWSPLALALAKAFWPGPLTLILHRADLIPFEVTGGQDSVGIRVPDHAIAQKMLHAFAEHGSGLVAAPSANRFGGVSPTRASDVLKGLGPFLRNEDCVLKAWDCSVGLESTIVDCRDATPRMLRPGGLSRETLNAWLKANGFPLLETSLRQVNGQAQGPKPRVSGSLDSHYAPRCPLLVLSRQRMQDLLRLENFIEGLAPLNHGPVSMATKASRLRVGCLVLEPWESSSFNSAPLERSNSKTVAFDLQALTSDPGVYASQFYQRLNDWDNSGADLILVESPPETQAWEALWDRLRRAATHY